MKKVIAFALFGTDQMYLQGMIENAKLCKMYYPDWICRCYISKDITTDFAYQLLDLDVDVVRHLGTLDFKAQWVRMEVALDETVDVFLIRDCDSRLNHKEAAAVKEFLESDKMVHIMRDHKKHTSPIMGGMWGAKKGFLDIEEYRTLYRNAVLKVRAGKTKRKKYYKKNGLSDQGFLGNDIWELVKSPTIHLAHGLKNKFTGEEKKFPCNLKNRRFVGQQVTAEGKYIYVS